jgi:hypothetical protein
LERGSDDGTHGDEWQRLLDQAIVMTVRPVIWGIVVFFAVSYGLIALMSLVGWIGPFEALVILLISLAVAVYTAKRKAV